MSINQILNRTLIRAALTLACGTSIATVLTIASPVIAQANTIVRTVSTTQAQGLSGGGATVTLWSGSGTNIDFTRTSETIERAWLDDPSQITIDFDGALCGRRTGKGCQSSGASIVHLRRINKIKFPNLPSSNQTLLTVVTRSNTESNTERKTYLFRVTYGSGKPQYANLIVMPESRVSSGNAITSGIQLSDGRTANWNDVDRGLQQAVRRGLIRSDSPVIARVAEFLAIVRNGTPMSQAIRSSHVSLALISKLAEMGYSTTAIHRSAFKRFERFEQFER